MDAEFSVTVTTIKVIKQWQKLQSHPISQPTGVRQGYSLHQETAFLKML